MEGTEKEYKENTISTNASISLIIMHVIGQEMLLSFNTAAALAYVFQ